MVGINFLNFRMGRLQCFLFLTNWNSLLQALIRRILSAFLKEAFNRLEATLLWEVKNGELRRSGWSHNASGKLLFTTCVVNAEIRKQRLDSSLRSLCISGVSSKSWSKNKIFYLRLSYLIAFKPPPVATALCIAFHQYSFCTDKSLLFTHLEQWTNTK